LGDFSRSIGTPVASPVASSTAWKKSIINWSHLNTTSVSCRDSGRCCEGLSESVGTMRKVKEEKRREAQAEPNDDMILRILRMRPEAAGYLRDRARQKEKVESIAAMDAIVARSVQQGPGRMGSFQNIGRR